LCYGRVKAVAFSAGDFFEALIKYLAGVLIELPI